MTEFRLKIAFTAALIAFDAAWIVWRGFTFDMASLATCISVGGAMALIGLLYTKFRPDERLATMGTETAFLIVYSAAGCIFSYLMTTLDRPLIDNVLAAWDTALGFNWYGYVAFVNRHPFLGDLSSLVYQSTLGQVALSVVVLCLLGKTDRTRELTATVMLSSFICIAIAGIVPSAGALAYYHPSSAFYMQNHPVVDIAYKQVFFDLRAGLMTHLSLVDAHGLVAFPSYHVGMSLIVILAFRGMKGWIFWPLVALNILVILSTPIDGGHHLSDGLGGLVLVLVSWGAINWLRKRLPKPANAAGEENYGELAGQKA